MRPYLIHHLLEASARQAPDAPAVLDAERTLTYRELEAQANQVAQALVGLGVQRGDRVGLYLQKSIEAIVAVYGVLKAGAAYVPLDPQAPVSRLAYVLADADARVLISGAQQQTAWSELRIEAQALESVVVMNGNATATAGLTCLGVEDLAGQPTVPPPSRTLEADLAYVLYTSAPPAGPRVMLTHRNCLAFVDWAVAEFAIDSTDRLSSHAPLHFDLSTFDLFAAAGAGALVALVPAHASMFPAQTRMFIEEVGITVWYSVPSALTMLVLRGGLRPGALPRLRAVLFAGEVFPTRHLRTLMDLLPTARFANLYGPTETNVCTWWPVERPADEDDAPIPIGRAIDGVEVFVLADDGRPAAPGEPGELVVRGPTVMQGYLGDPEKTAARRVTDPRPAPVPQPVYHTGDVVSAEADGVLRFLGRRDEQVKSRGYRIELGEVEAAIGAHPAVVECVVLARPDELIGSRLEAHVVAREPLEVADVLAFCADRVPHYMVPETVHFADGLPRTSTGKLDRRALAGR